MVNKQYISDTSNLFANEYRFGFNGQEKDQEIYNNQSTTSATFWEYDGRNGRRWNLDPQPQISISDYAVMGNNPIMNIDVKGDKWKDKIKDGKKAENLNKKLEYQKNKLNSKADGLEKQAKNFKGDKQQNMLEQASEARTGAENLQAAQTELIIMGSDKTDQEFTFKQNTGATFHRTYMDKNKVIVMEYGSEASAIHELKHGFQHLTWQIKLTPGTGKGEYADATDEQEAFKRQYFFSPNSVKGLN